ncbi:MAG: Fis family transcriptional regulator [Ignavibacteria bacterium CG_4_8_14_3_um_filter_37_9]|nr:sigma-54-dependent Fis family transcriptional regulator [Ignavibacteria bacterium]OIO15839.1 MAG: Fis family transcriptional regulator [Ignavibacteria bacterium CG1_02_37_35]PIS46136.1 MAG: Fis family transcriptional regulator [Ignavibacteria bacterium CG08_land_8_20_14_0_20_37_9]PIW99986.1 MAG: Fis family transcriptional regulator [Ignavibacteria bacterium CG_4_8_14_3_um_filter_37_9]PIX93067.1 MAG: Fis family transcriptional regulator [Ignavibacteria bacterium CG_4_10_14_3_um_filter_37_18]
MPGKILVVDDEKDINDSLSFILEKEGYIVEQAENGKVAYEKILNSYYDLVITDIEMPMMKGTELLEKISALTPQTSVIMITAYGSLETTIKALRNGAQDYILKPIEFDEILIKIKRLFEIKNLVSENQLLRKEIQRNYDFSELVGKSPAMHKVFEMIQTVAETESTVLITGNSGTGKELVARAIHFNSKRKNKPFVAVNCGAISENLIESELFGHKRGAFTGAISDKEGYLKAADGGTLFLDEISEMPLPLQVKLLRVIQEKEITPVGTTYSIPINVRFVATTNKKLEAEVESGRFREDLFYRLNVVELNLPSLKERAEDIPILADHFVNKYRKEIGKNVKGVESSAMRALLHYEWRGEVRELENIIERAVIFAKNEYITIEDLPQSMHLSKDALIPEKPGSLDDFIKKVEKGFILKSLETNEFDKEKVAKQLNLGLSTLYRKIKDYGLEQ